jgi:DNA-binding SARP family transcriptional activator/tetratricopeptide (TPR) repeat protein
VEFRLLGPVELWDGDRRCELGSTKERYVLAMLLLADRKPVSIDSMIDGVWENAPSKARASIHTYITRLRGRLDREFANGDAHIVSRAGAYALEVDPELVDVQRFRELHRQARSIADSGDDEEAIRLLAQAERLWRGQPLSDLRGEWAENRRTALVNEHRAGIGKRIALELGAGRHNDLVAELSGLVAQHPYDEAFVEYLMVALYRCGRQSDALEVYRQARDRLVSELGTEPGPALRVTHDQILAGDAGLLTPATRGRPPSARLANNLPRDIPTFTGRGSELDRLYATLESTPTAVTVGAIDGMAGIGKTTLATHIAHRLAGRYPDGRIFLDLRGHDPHRDPLDPADGLEILLRMVGEDSSRIPETLDERVALWRERLAERRVLLVLDDAERADQVTPLLPGAPGCLVLITSRSRLVGLNGVRSLSLDVLAPEEASLLFRQTVGPDRRLDTQAVDEIVRSCGYLPLAITISATLLRNRPARSIEAHVAKLTRTKNRLAQLRVGDLDLATAFELSYRDLSPDRRRAFRRLGLHIGADVTVDAAAALIDCDRADAEEALEDLIDHHLIEEPHSGRFRFHDLLREYARECVAREEPVDEPRRAAQRLLDFYLNTADQADRVLYPYQHRADASFPAAASDVVGDARTATEWLRDERANLVACARYADEYGFPAYAVRFSSALATFLKQSAHWDDAGRLHEMARRICQRNGDRRGEARAAVELSEVRSRTGHYDASLEHGRAAHRIFQELGDGHGQADALDQLALASWLSGNNRRALSYAEEAIALYRAVGGRNGESNALLHRGIALSYLGHITAAAADFEESLAIAKEVGNTSNEAINMNNLGELQYKAGYHRDALEMFRVALAGFRETGWRQHEAVALNNIANVHQYKGRHDEALHFYREALTIHRETGDRRNEADALSNIGASYVHLEQYAEALIHLQKALTLAEEIGEPYEQACALQRIGEAQRGSGRLVLAGESYQRALALSRDVADPYLEARCLDGIGEIAFKTGGREAAETYWHQALGIYEGLGAPEAEVLRVRLQEL